MNYPLILRGYIFADGGCLEIKLFDILLSLNGSGFIRQRRGLEQGEQDGAGKAGDGVRFISESAAKHEL
jgi:hypothetical protein